MKLSLRSRLFRCVSAVIAIAFTLHAMPVDGQISAGREHVIVVNEADGSLWGWGNNANGELGNSVGGISSAPIQIQDDRWKVVAAGGKHSVAIRDDGSIWSWGANKDGQLGRNDFEDDALPGRIGIAVDWKTVAAGDSHTLALRENGDLYAWGNNFYGQLGDGSTTESGIPVKVKGGPYVAIAAGEGHSLAIDSDGRLWAWGNDLSGQLGIGASPSVEQSQPVQVGSVSDWVSVAAGLEHSLGVRSDGSLYGWGRNLEGQLGIGTWGSLRNTPVRIGNGNSWSQVAAGELHSVALRQDGTLWTWGHNFSGQLGHGSTANELQPRQVGSDSDWTAIAAGSAFTVALKQDGAGWSSGENNRGQLGNERARGQSNFAPTHYGMPDLVVDLSMPAEIVPGQTISANVFVRNRGSGPIVEGSDFEIEIVGNVSPEWSGTVRSLFTFSVSAPFAAGESRGYVHEIDLPTSIAVGDYFFGAYVDRDEVVSESNKENNDFWIRESIEILADLAVGEISLDPQTIERGDSWPLSVSIRNLGIGDIPAGTPVFVEVRISGNPVWDAETNIILVDKDLYEEDLAAGETALIEFDSVAIPVYAPPGDYYLGVYVYGDGFKEIDENNNIRWSDAANLTITGLELEEGLGSESIDWETGGDSRWYAQNQELFEENPVVQTPPLTVGQETWIEGSVDGPVLVRFHWKIESQSRNNYLAFSVNGTEEARIFGWVDWQERAILAPGFSNKLRWTYVKTEETDGSDAAWLSGITLEPVTKPDLIVTDVDFEPGEYVLQRDKITIRAYGKNRGLPAQIPEKFRMEVRLSKNRDWESDESISLGFLNQLQGLGSDNQFIYQATLGLPETIPAGAYYVGVFADSTDLIDEFDETNNIGWSEEAAVEVVRLPDLRVANLSYEPGVYTIHHVGEERDELRLRFDLVNAGLADLPADSFTGHVLLSPDRDLAGNEAVLLEFKVEQGLPAGQARTYSITTGMSPDANVGQFQYVGIVVDVDDEVAESREDNNFALSDFADIFVQERTLGVALGREDLDWGTGSDLESPPWYGQSEVFFSQSEPLAAARVAKNIPIGSQADMQTTITVQGPSPVSFFWKVDSAQQFDGDGNLVNFNDLAFFIDHLEVAAIRGEIDWHQRTFHLPEAGTYALRWSYRKRIPADGTADTGWVDQMTYTAPDLVLAGVDYLPGTYEEGDLFDYSVKIANQGGLSVPITPSYSVQVRLSPNPQGVHSLDWTELNATDVILDTFELTDPEQRALGIGEEIELFRSIFIPGGLDANRNLHLGAWVDYTGRIEEGNKANNLWWADSADLRLLTSLSLADVLELELMHPDGWRIGGNGAWSGQVGEFDRSVPGNSSAAQSPLLKNNEKAWFEAEIEGPALLDFSWKVSSRENYNFLRLYVSGKFEKEISGEVDWEEGGSVFIPAGPQRIRFSYEKTSADNDSLDTGWVDNIRLTEVTTPDLLITSVSYVPGAYVLERDRFRVTITAENRGAPFPSGMAWETSDMEVRLSSNKVAGDEDDVILGDFARVESFESGARLVFSGDLHLPHFPELPEGKLFEGEYYLIATVDAMGRIDEFDHENNRWISDANDIHVRRLPHLISDEVVFDFDKTYFPHGPLEVDWLLRNRGLGDITGEIPYIQKIELYAVERDEPNFDNPTFVAELSVFSENAYMPGVNAVHLHGSSIPIYSRLTLPSPAEILAGLGEVDHGLEEEDPRVLENRFKIEADYRYYLAITTDTGMAIEQSSDLRIAHYVGALFDIGDPLNQPVSYNEWLELYPELVSTDRWDSPAGDRLPNLLKYALDLNPLLPHAGGSALFDAFGVRNYGGNDYFRITFNMVRLASDLRYIVEVSEDLSSWNPLVVLEPPYENLTGTSGLISHPLVISASHQGYTAAVTVRDVLPVSEAPVRFLRLRIEEK